MLKRLIQKDAQSVIEYSMIAGFVIIAVMAMNPMIKRMSQSMIKTAADQIGTQQNAEQASFSDIDKGYMVGSNILTGSQIDKYTDDVNGIITYTYEDSVTTNRKTEVHLGFQPEN